MVRVINIAVILFFLIISIVFIFNPFSYKSSQDNGTSNKKLILVVEQDTFYIPFKDGEFNLYSNVVDINGKNHPAYTHSRRNSRARRARARAPSSARRIVAGGRSGQKGR